MTLLDRDGTLTCAVEGCEQTGPLAATPVGPLCSDHADKYAREHYGRGGSA